MYINLSAAVKQATDGKQTMSTSKQSWVLNKFEDTKIYTFQIQSLAEACKLGQLITELKTITWDLVGINKI